MKLKGHTKIELFNAKTGELEQCIEDDNMFTNVLDRILNNNLGGLLPYDQKANNYSKLFPLPQYALGGVMLLPQAETENANNFYPHSVPTAFGQRDRVSIAGSTGTGIYNQTESGEIKDGYKHVWEYTTEQGNGQIACACLTNYYGAFGDFNMDEFYSQYKMTGVQATSFVGVNSKGKLVAIDISPLSSIHTPTFKIIDTGIIVTDCNSLKDNRFDSLTATYGSSSSGWTNFNVDKSNYVNAVINTDYETRIKGYWKPDKNNYERDLSKRTFGFYWGAFNYDETHAIIFIVPWWTWFYESTLSFTEYALPNYMDAYLVDLDTAETTFLQTIFFPWVSTSGNITSHHASDYYDNEGRSDTTRSATIHYNYDVCNHWGNSTYETDGVVYQLQPVMPDLMNSSSGREFYNPWKDMIVLNKKLVYYGARNYSVAAGQEQLYLYVVDLESGQINNYLCPSKMCTVGAIGEGWGGALVPIYPNSNLLFVWDRIVFDMNTGQFKVWVTPYQYSAYDRQGMAVLIHQPVYSNGFCNIIQAYRGSMYHGNSRMSALYLGYQAPYYMATINNLPTPITKTSDQTMKVTYTIMDAVEEEGNEA